MIRQVNFDKNTDTFLSMTFFLKKVLKFKAQNSLDMFFGIALALNLVNYQSVDLIFSFLGIIAAYTFMKTKDGLWFKKLFLQANAFNLFVIMYIASGIFGYITSSNIENEQLNEIMNLRWILSFYCCFYGGYKAKASNSELKLNSPVLPIVLVIIMVIHAKISKFGLTYISNRLTGFYENPNHFALTIVLAWAFYLGFLIRTPSQTERKNKFAFIQILTFFLLTIELFVTYSRSSWIGALAALIVGVIYSKDMRLIPLAGGSILIGFAGIFFNAFGLKDRLLGTLDLSPTGVEAGRLSVWKVNWQIFLDHPIFGVGIEEARRLYPIYYERLHIPKEFIVGHAHNQFLHVLSGTGIIGFSAYLGIFTSGIIFFNKAYRAKKNATEKKIAFSSILVIVALFCSSVTDAPFRLHECRNYILILLGFAAGYLYYENIQKTM